MGAEIPVNTTPPNEPTTEDVQMEEDPAVNQSQEDEQDSTMLEASPDVKEEPKTEVHEEPTLAAEEPPATTATNAEEPATTTAAEEPSEDPIVEKPTVEDPTTSVVEETENIRVKQESIQDPMQDVESSEPPPFLSAPASWQIPVAALHQQQQQQQQKPVDAVVSKTSLRKERLEARIKESKYDIEAWTSLINDAQQTGDLEAIRDIYERFLKVFPTSVSFFFLFFSFTLLCFPFFLSLSLSRFSSELYTFLYESPFLLPFFFFDVRKKKKSYQGSY